MFYHIFLAMHTIWFSWLNIKTNGIYKKYSYDIQDVMSFIRWIYVECPLSKCFFFQFFILKIILSKQCNKSDCSTFSWSRMTGRKIRNRISKQNIYPIGWAAQKIFMGESRSIKYLLIELLMIFHNVQLYLAKGQHHISL